MTQNANLKRQRELAEHIIAVIDEGNAWQYHTLTALAEDLARLAAQRVDTEELRALQEFKRQARGVFVVNTQSPSSQ